MRETERKNKCKSLGYSANLFYKIIIDKVKIMRRGGV